MECVNVVDLYLRCFGSGFYIQSIKRRMGYFSMVLKRTDMYHDRFTGMPSSIYEFMWIVVLGCNERERERERVLGIEYLCLNILCRQRESLIKFVVFYFHGWLFINVANLKMVCVRPRFVFVLKTLLKAETFKNDNSKMVTFRM